MGSSVGVFGVSAERLSRQVGGSVLNVSRHGASSQATAMLLPDVLRLKPETVVVMVSALELRADQVADWGRIYDPNIAWALRSDLPSDPSAHLEGVLGWGSMLYRHREGLRGQLAERFGLKSARFLVGGDRVPAGSVFAVLPDRKRIRRPDGHSSGLDMDHRRGAIPGGRCGGSPPASW